MGVAERKQREQERKECVILDAAEKVFAARGFAATTVEDIAGEAEYSVGTLYNVIGNKETILARVCARILVQLEEAWPKPMIEEPVMPQLSRIFRAYVDTLFSRLDQVRLLRAFDSPDIQQRVDPVVLQQIKQFRLDSLQPLLRLLEAGQARKEIRTDAPPAQLSFIFFALLASFVNSIDLPEVSEIEEQFGFESKSLLHQGVTMLLDSLTVK